jgi:hypothetical protein
MTSSLPTGSTRTDPVAHDAPMGISSLTTPSTSYAVRLEDGGLRQKPDRPTPAHSTPDWPARSVSVERAASTMRSPDGQ